MRKCRFAVRVCMTAISLGSAPIIGAILLEASLSTSSQMGRGESERGLKCPNTPWVPHVVRYWVRRSEVRLGCSPREFPQRYIHDSYESSSEITFYIRIALSDCEEGGSNLDLGVSCFLNRLSTVSRIPFVCLWGDLLGHREPKPTLSKMSPRFLS